MEKRIVYKNENGDLVVLTPTPEWLETRTVLDAAQKDVPAGVPYLIVDVSDVPEDRTFRNAWDADFSNPDGYGLGVEAWLAQQADGV